MFSDQPRAFRDPAALTERLRHLDEPHVAPLTEWVQKLRTRLGSDAIVPWFDPADGGINAGLLWLLEAPGPKATRERGGSGIVSCNNNDGAAENTWRTRTEAGVGRHLVVHWNVIPYYIGTETTIRAWDPGDVANAGPMLAELVSLLPHLRSVVLGGEAAQVGWREHKPSMAHAREFPCPHPSVTNVNTRPWVRPLIVQAWRDAAAWAAR